MKWQQQLVLLNALPVDVAGKTPLLQLVEKLMLAPVVLMLNKLLL